MILGRLMWRALGLGILGSILIWHQESLRDHAVFRFFIMLLTRLSQFSALQRSNPSRSARSFFFWSIATAFAGHTILQLTLQQTPLWCISPWPWMPVLLANILLHSFRLPPSVQPLLALGKAMQKYLDQQRLVHAVDWGLWGLILSMVDLSAGGLIVHLSVHPVHTWKPAVGPSMLCLGLLHGARKMYQQEFNGIGLEAWTVWYLTHLFLPSPTTPKAKPD